MGNDFVHQPDAVLATPERASLRLAFGKTDVEQGWDHIETKAKRAMQEFSDSVTSNMVAVPGTVKVEVVLEVWALAYRVPTPPEGIEGLEFDFPDGIKEWWRGLVESLNPRDARRGLLYHFPVKRSFWRGA